MSCPRVFRCKEQRRVVNEGMTEVVKQLFEQLWRQYVEVTPSALEVHKLLGTRQSQPIINDHVAFRTFDHPKLNLSVLTQHFTSIGYTKGGDYFFEKKKLRAEHYEHPDPTQPKVFISELLTSEFSSQLQDIVARLIDEVDEQWVLQPSFLYYGCPWSVSYVDYLTLQKESEYAAWMAAWGYRVNHFTVSVNELQNFGSIQEVNRSLVEAGFTLNTSGGEIKGTPADLLEQSSTMADKHRVAFLDGIYEVPSCFYEFARRYPDGQGRMFSGFVTQSADKIFESTHANTANGHG